MINEKTLHNNRKENFMLFVLPKSEGGDEEIKKLGGEKEKNEKQYEKYTEGNYSGFVCGDDGCECFGGSASC